MLVFLTLVVGVMGGYLFFSSRSQATAPNGLVGAPHGQEEVAAGPELPPRGLRLAQGWKCMCGSCTDDLLVCHCDDPNGAHEIKGAIRDAIAAGLSEDEILSALVQRYGPGLLGPQGGGTGSRPPAPAGEAAGEAAEETG